MPNLDKDWVTRQLASARVPKPVGKALVRLTEVWNELDLTEEFYEQTVELFSELALGHSIAETGPGTWVPANVGAMLQVGDIVRVKTDAFSSAAAGHTHNGRQGKVVAKRSGDIIVDLTDDLGPKLQAVHYPASKLEKLVTP
ncbi:hypothetical protein QEH42_gp107 [Microbacterium phage Pumpernickel]|uniref:Uncharacterized protein n=1 Tax=Microbacterium phage Pumpernickel TaxID=2885983 RepID=A0AAE8Y8B8_9CAUD|nr:hypothetical protein QEH42_gp107 [Microbacterium phage Pumpernickel]UDL15898.1 hypothetical protein SEA_PUMPERNICKEL_107 [Microbacterium phage Pumpernickel]